MQEEDPRLRGPTTLTSKSVAVFPLLTQLDPEAFLPHGVWGGSCLGRAGAKVGSTKDGELSGYIPAESPILEVPAAGWCGQHPSAGHCPAWPSCQRIVGLPQGQCQGVCQQGRGLGKGWSWEGVGAGSSTGDIFVTAIVRANGNGTIFSYCCQRDVSLLLLWECGWGLIWVCVFVSY